MFYYHAQKGKKLVAGGLLYPLSEPHNKEVCKSDKLFGLADAVSGNFVIDGIELNEENTNDNIFDDIETKFINRINLLIPQNQTNVLQTF
jgi:hypothetical protein